MRVFKAHRDVHDALKEKEFKTLGLVPTMGALHEGHLNLVRQSTQENEITLVSIFVNPTQFDDPNDLEKYPKTLASDLLKLKEIEGTVWVYTPDATDLYQNKPTADVYALGEIENLMEGASRKGHFQGVATVVDKLLTVFAPTKAYFGEKDYQQLKIIHRLVQLRQLDVAIVDCPISREVDGLAMSSRNRRLNPNERSIAPLIYETLVKARSLKTSYSPPQITAWVDDFFKSQSLFELDYFSIVDQDSLLPLEEFSSNTTARAFIAVKLGDIRLIDNLKF